MNLAHLQHSINWWTKNGHIDIKLLTAVLESKAGISSDQPKKKLFRFLSIITKK